MSYMPSSVTLRHFPQRIIASPLGSGQSTSPGFVQPQMFVRNAGAVALAANAAILRAQPAQSRDIQATTGSPGAASIVGAAGSSGTDGGQASLSITPIDTTSAISGPPGTPAARVPRGRRGGWMKYALIGAGVIVLVAVMR